jgi:DNA-binding CsgD family transcriptional regulator
VTINCSATCNEWIYCYVSISHSQNVRWREISEDRVTRWKGQRPRPSPGLSPRASQVLRLVADGNSSKVLAVMLNPGLHAVHSYRKTLMKKLGVNNVAALTQVAIPNAAPPLDGYQ